MNVGDDDLADIVGDSNGPVYRKTEESTGPPLEYVGERPPSLRLRASSCLLSRAGLRSVD
jgi:hypothetical protein